MTPVPEPTFFDPASVPTFALHDAAGALLVRLPPTVGLPDPLGQPDPYTWDRQPGSAAWFPLGDGLPRERPTVTLSGDWQYWDTDAALAAINAIELALKDARELWWRGVRVAFLDARKPGVSRPRLMTPSSGVQHQLILNTDVAVTAATLAASAALPPVQAWQVVVQPLARDGAGNFLRGAEVLTSLARTNFDPNTGNMVFRFASPILLTPLAGLLARNPQQHRTRGGTFHVIADPSLGLVRVQYTLLDAGGPDLSGLTTGVLALDVIGSTPAQTSQSLTFLRCDRLHLRDGGVVTA